MDAHSVLAEESISTRVMSGLNGTEDRVDGAKLVIRPPDGITAERLTRILQCHAARALLGQDEQAVLRDDPFWLPNAWIHVDVRPEDGNYAVRLEADDLPTSIKIAERAREYAATHALAAR